MAIPLLILSLLLLSMAGIVALLGSHARLTYLLSQGFSLTAGLSALLSALLAWGASQALTVTLLEVPYLGYLRITIDGLAALFIGLVGAIGLVVSLYTLATAPLPRLTAFFIPLFLATMLLVVTTDNAFLFFFYWEWMTLLSYLLVIWRYREEENLRAGYLYIVVAHIGAACLLCAFLLLFWKSGTFQFRIWRQSWFEPPLRNLVFSLFFLGFGIKAGMVPFHFWAPRAYRAAPDPAAALMAAVMKKMAIYGLLRFGVHILGASVAWWGVLVMAFGVGSALIGAFYALTEQDLKRLLAYSSVENVGIILMGIGLGMFALAQGQAGLALLGFIAAGYHLVNHAFFKALLFLGGDQVRAQAGSQDLNQLGGLARRMPWTAGFFLIGALAAAAIPPLNGFVSEWLTLQAFLAAGSQALFAMQVLAPLGAVLLALASALAVMVYLKAFGSIFSGPARQPTAAQASEGPLGARLSLGILAAGCAILGLASPWLLPQGVKVVSAFTDLPPAPLARGMQVFALEPQRAVLSLPLITLLLVGMILVPLVAVALTGGLRAEARRNVPPWACGYGYSAPMSLSASAFNQPVVSTFSWLYTLRRTVTEPFGRLTKFFHATVERARQAEPLVESAVVRPTTRLVEAASQWIQALQMGDIRLYCLYIILTLAILLIAIFGRRGL